MAKKVIINLKKGTEINDFQDKDILMYDATDKSFYRVTPELFYNDYEGKLTDLLKRYDDTVKDLKEEVAAQKRGNEAFKKEIQKINDRLIEMVESFIKGDKQ